MKITFPHMGNMHIAVKGLLEYLDLDVVVPPKSNQRALTLGVKYSPEFACLPFKVAMGNLIEAHELGADTVIMSGGVGPCRFGMYAEVIRRILAEQGYEYQSLVIDPDKKLLQFLNRFKQIVGNKSWFEIYKAIKFGYKKTIAVDMIERKVEYLRPREKSEGTVDRIYKDVLKNIDNAMSFKSIEEATGLGLAKLESTPLDLSKQIIKIGFIGEIYTLLEPFTNLDLEKELGKLGVEVERSMYLSQWANTHLLAGLDKNNRFKPFAKLAKPYLNYFVGGHGRETVGYAVGFSREGFDGLIQMAPLTCMPEIVAHSVLPSLKKDIDIPILTLYVDEQAGKAGVLTRIEAFVDLIKRQKRAERRMVNGCIYGN